MTAHEVIDQIKALPDQEKAKVIDFVQALDPARPAGREMDQSTFDQAASRVFTRHTDLMRKLSQ
jgi:hypothetical protein